MLQALTVLSVCDCGSRAGAVFILADCVFVCVCLCVYLAECAQFSEAGRLACLYETHKMTKIMQCHIILQINCAQVCVACISRHACEHIGVFALYLCWIPRGLKAGRGL